MNSNATTSKHVIMLGAGYFGTALAQHLANLGHIVEIWSIDNEIVESINSQHQNAKYYSSVILSERISATNRITTYSLERAAAVVVAIPTQAVREVLSSLKNLVPSNLNLIYAAKGIEISTLKLPHELITDVLGSNIGAQSCYLSGPSFASEIMDAQPTAVAIAGFNESALMAAQNLFHAPHFRVYRSNDPIGVGVAGAIKNVIAIASGALSGLGFQSNARAALLTRGLAEISRIGEKLGAHPLTFTGLAGVGDLFLTCTSEKSRNFHLGFRLGRGESLENILGSLDSVAEGYTTAKAVNLLTDKLQIDAPISSQVYEVLYERKPIADAVQTLLTREPKAERA